MKNILVVDDTHDNLRLLSELLTKHGYDVRPAPSGRRAISSAKSRVPDLILLDIMMPDMDGYEVCTRLKADESTRDIPIIFLSAKTETADEQKGLELGAVDYITKPIIPAVLMMRIKTHLRLKEANDLLRNQAEILERTVRERTRELSLTNQALARFVPEEFLKHIHRDSIIDVQLGEQIKKNMTILFSDIRGFTALSEQMSPQENFTLINAYLSRIGPVIREYHGFIDKYIGDAIMALFPTHADDAVGCALAMLKKLQEYNLERQQSGYAPIQIGIGVNTGELMLGTVGEQDRMDTTVISDAVNLASRLESITKYYGVSLVVSEMTFVGLRDPNLYHYRLLDKVKVQGKAQPLAIYEMFDADPDDLRERKLRMQSLFATGQYHYFSREFAEAVKCFTGVLRVLPEDVTTKQYLQRSATFLLNGVPDDWQGVRIMEQK